MFSAMVHTGWWTLVSQDTTLFTYSAQYFAKSRIVKPKLTHTFHLTGSWNGPRNYKNSKENFCLNIPSSERNEGNEFQVIFGFIFGVVFYHLIRGDLSVVTGATLPKRHICSVGTDATFPNRHIRSSNRHIHSAKMGYPRIDTSIRSERVQRFRINMSVRRTDLFIRIPLLMLD